MCINNYRWPFEKYRLQKIYFGVYTTAQKNVTCLNVREIQRFFFFSEVGERMPLLMVCGDPQLEGHLAAQQCETVCDHSSKTSCPVSLWVFFFFFFNTAFRKQGSITGEPCGEPWSQVREGRQRRQAGRV